MLIISRPDVSSQEIQKLPKPFIRLGIQTYLSELNIEPVPSQIALINAVNRYRFVTAALSRRQGKTFIANVIGQLTALIPNHNVLIMSPNYNLSQISFDLQKNMFVQQGVKTPVNNQKEKVIQAENGSTIRMGSVNQADSVVGRSYDLIIFDEAALSDGKEAFEIQLRPTLDKPHSRAIFISTPRGRTNWFHEMYQRGFSDKFPEWCSIRATWEANPRVSLADIEEARLTSSAANFSQEYEADFNSYEGQIWKLPAESIVDNYELSDDCDYIAGLDIGFRDSTALVILAYDWKQEKYFVVDEYLDNEKTTAQYAAEIRERLERWNVDISYIDSAAQQTRFDFAKDYGISTANAKKSVLDGIGHVSSLVESGRVIVPKHCKHVLDAFDGFAWDDSGTLAHERPKRNDSKHMADAIRYAIYSHGEM